MVYRRKQTVLVIPLRGKLNGCCQALVVVFAAVVVTGVCRMFVGCGCLQRTMVAVVAWQQSLRRGAASKDGTLRHRHRGTTWLAADRGGLLSLVGLSDAVHHRKTAQATSSTG